MQSKFKSDYGKFEWTAGKFYGDAEKDKGMDFGFVFFLDCGELLSHIANYMVRDALNQSLKNTVFYHHITWYIKAEYTH